MNVGMLGINKFRITLAAKFILKTIFSNISMELFIRKLLRRIGRVIVSKKFEERTPERFDFRRMSLNRHTFDKNRVASGNRMRQPLYLHYA